MMKNYLIALSLFLISDLFAQKEISLTGKTVNAIVYLNGAQLEKQLSCSLPKGKSTIVIKNITPLLVEESIQVKGEGDFTILSVNQQLVYEEIKKDKTDLNQLQAKEAQLEVKIEDEMALLQVLNEQETLFNTNKTIIDNENSLKADELKAMLELHASNIKEAKLKQLAHKRTIRKLNEELNDVKNKINAYQLIEEEVTREVRVEVITQQSTKANFQLFYLVPNAKWYPSYDVIAKKVGAPIQLKYYANISQQTGEDWKDINVTLSTTDPNQNASKPELQPWRLRLNQNTMPSYTKTKSEAYSRLGKFSKVGGIVRDAETNEPLPFVNVVVSNSSIGASTDFDGKFSLTLPPEANELNVTFVGYEPNKVKITGEVLDIALQPGKSSFEEFVVIDYKEKLIDAEEPSRVVLDASKIQTTAGISSGRVYGFRSKRNRSSNRVKMTPVKIVPVKNVVNKQFKIESPVEVPSNIKSYKVEMKELNIKADFEHFCVPKIDPSVFLTANITNWEQYDLLEGQTNIYFEDTYIGNTLLDVAYLSDTLVLSLGVDKNVQVERKKEKDYTKQRILGNNKKETRLFSIETRNGKDSPIQLVIQDQIPLTTNNKVDIESEISDNGKVEEATGIITWDVKLEPKTNKELSFQYEISYPKEYWMAIE